MAVKAAGSVISLRCFRGPPQIDASTHAFQVRLHLNEALFLVDLPSTTIKL